MKKPSQKEQESKAKYLIRNSLGILLSTFGQFFIIIAAIKAQEGISLGQKVLTTEVLTPILTGALLTHLGYKFLTKYWAI